MTLRLLIKPRHFAAEIIPDGEGATLFRRKLLATAVTSWAVATHRITFSAKVYAAAGEGTASIALSKSTSGLEDAGGSATFPVCAGGRLIAESARRHRNHRCDTS